MQRNAGHRPNRDPSYSYSFRLASLSPSSQHAKLPRNVTQQVFQVEIIISIAVILCWIDYRNSPLLRQQADDDLALVRKYQTQLRQAGDTLLKREIEQIDRRTHPRDYLAAPKRYCDSSQGAGATLTVPEAVIDATAELVSRNSVHSASCWVQDYWLWRALVHEQVRRSESTGQPPQSALHLSGPDRGLPDFSIGDWGGQVHIPYEGACVANLHFKPRWKYLYPYDETPPDDTPCRFFRPKPMIHDEMCLYLITDEDFGALSGAMREKICDGWFLYTRLGMPGLNQRSTSPTLDGVAKPPGRQAGSTPLA